MRETERDRGRERYRGREGERERVENANLLLHSITRKFDTADCDVFEEHFYYIG